MTFGGCYFGAIVVDIVDVFDLGDPSVGDGAHEDSCAEICDADDSDDYGCANDAFDQDVTDRHLFHTPRRLVGVALFKKVRKVG